jgi:hypothetical protein
MRWIGWILAILFAVGWVAAELPPIVAPAESADIWRRTSDGWEKADWLLPEPAPDPIWLHPALLATLQVALSVVGFLAVSRSCSTKPESSKALALPFSS